MSSDVVWPAWIAIWALHLGSFFTTLAAVYIVIIRTDFLNPVSRTIIVSMFSSAFITDSAYSYALFRMSLKGKVLFDFENIIGELLNVLYFHEIGFAGFAIGIFLTASERLLSSFFDCSAPIKQKLLLYPLCGIIIIFILIISFIWSVMLTGLNQRIAAVSCFVLFSLSSLQLFLAMIFNIKNYKKGLGQALERRFRSATIYYFNRHLFISLVGEILFRVTAFSVLFSTQLEPWLSIEWASFFYHNFVYCILAAQATLRLIIPVGNLLFPWFLIAGRGKNTIFLQKKKKGVTDLTGNQLKLKSETTEHYDAIYKLWR